MSEFLRELIHKAIETIVVVVTTAIAKRGIEECKNKCKKTTPQTPSKRKEGGLS